MFKKILVLVMFLASCGREEQTKPYTPPVATGGIAEENKANLLELKETFIRECGCAEKFEGVEFYVVDSIPEGAYGRYMVWPHGRRVIEVWNLKFQHTYQLKHIVWHEMGHAVGFSHTTDNLIMKHYDPSAQLAFVLENSFDEFLVDLFK